MGPGSRVPGPALIAEKETTTYVSSRYTAHLDGSGNIILDMKDAV